MEMAPKAHGKDNAQRRKSAYLMPEFPLMPFPPRLLSKITLSFCFFLRSLSSDTKVCYGHVFFLRNANRQLTLNNMCFAGGPPKNMCFAWAPQYFLLKEKHKKNKGVEQNLLPTFVLPGYSKFQNGRGEGLLQGGGD